MSFTPLLILHAVSLLVGGVIIAFAVRYRRAHGVQAFAVGVAGQMLWTFGYACEVLTPSLAGKIFWDDFQLLGTIGWVTGFYRFAVRYTDRNPRWVGLATVATVVVCGGYLVLAATDP